ncbi:MAG: tetratricopeptide repeat protein [Planctomycetia bacterium]|nr:tetratricopeptide repeat protein [Planctomycetia bacterium]
MLLRAVLAVAIVAAVGGCRLPVPYGASRSIMSSRQLSQRGAGALGRQNWAEAESLFAEAVTTCPADVEARKNYGETLWHRGAKQAAIEQLEAATKIANEDASLWVRLADFRLMAGQVVEAKRDAEAAIDLDPRLADAWILRGRVERQLGDQREALADLHRALGYNPRNPQVLHELALTYFALDDPQRALSNLQSMLDQHSPGDEPQRLLYEVGMAYARLGRFDDAVDNLRLAVARDRPTADILCELSEVELARGRAAEARMALEQAAVLEPSNPRCRAILARLSQPAGATQAR